MAFNAAASGWEKRRAPLRWGVHLTDLVCAWSLRRVPLPAGPAWAWAWAWMDPKVGLEWVDGLGLGILGSDLNVSGLNLRFRISQIHSEKVSGSLAFRVRYFLIIGLSLRASNRECLQFSPLIFQKTAFMHSNFSKNQHATKHIHTNTKKWILYLIFTFRWGCRYTN